MTGGAVAAFAFPELTSGSARWAPLALSLVVLGMPHGAVDHHVADRLAPTSARLARRRRRRIVGAYAAGVLVGLALWAASPGAAVVAFLAVSAAHWGQGEGWWARAVAGRAAFGSPAGAIVWAAARGGLPIFGAALAHPEEAQAVAADLVERFGAGAADPVVPPAVRLAALALLGLVVLLAAAGSVRDHRRAGAGAAPGALGRDLGELAGLTLFFAAVPAAWAVGLYFLVWHAPRHVARLVAGSPAQAALLGERRHAAALLAFHREALPCSLAALAAWRGSPRSGRRDRPTPSSRPPWR
jgi:Brp/Blh family beta-carotene 15,15'-monooxygenase